MALLFSRRGTDHLVPPPTLDPCILLKTGFLVRQVPFVNNYFNSLDAKFAYYSSIFSFEII